MRITKTASIALAILAMACSQKQSSAGAAPATPVRNVAPVSAAPMPAASGASQLAGKVLETIDAGGYTYVRMETGAGEQWAAVRETKLTIGQNVVIDAEMTMEKFESKTLNRTFDSIVFGALAGSAGAGAATMPPPMTSAKSPKAENIDVPKAAGGLTVAELWASRTSLAGKPVVVRGKVVKFLSGIMGKNWVHLQDGTGSAAGGDHDITVTTEDVAAQGDVITVSGTLAIDRDFGSGYKYPAIIENGKLTK